MAGGSHEMSGAEEQAFRDEFHATAEELDAIHQKEARPHPGTGVEELFYLTDKHPSLGRFFEEGYDVLGFSEEGQKKFALLSQKYLDSILTPSERDILERYYLRYQIEKRRRSP